MRQYARHVDRAIRPVLAGLGLPLILAAAEPLDSIYRSVNGYPKLAARSIAGNPEDASAAELAAAARAILDAVYAAQLERRPQHASSARSNAGRGATDLTDVARAATFGAVDTLMVDIDDVVPGFVADPTAARHARRRRRRGQLRRRRRDRPPRAALRRPRAGAAPRRHPRATARSRRSCATRSERLVLALALLGAMAGCGEDEARHRTRRRCAAKRGCSPPGSTSRAGSRSRRARPSPKQQVSGSSGCNRFSAVLHGRRRRAQAGAGRGHGDGLPGPRRRGRGGSSAPRWGTWPRGASDEGSSSCSTTTAPSCCASRPPRSPGRGR